MTKMNKKLKLCAFLMLLTMLVLSPVSNTFSQEEPQAPKEENTLGDGLKAIQEAEGRLDPESEAGQESQVEGEPEAQVKETEEANEVTQEAAQENDPAKEPVGQEASSDETGDKEPGILIVPEDADEDSLPRGEDLRGTQQPRYSSAGLRDPFKPFLKLQNVPVGPDPIIRPPLRRYPLSSFRLAGIIWVGDQPKAMIVDPEENTYFLGVGDRIGNKEGEILEVRERGILVQEQTRFENVYGEVKTEVKKSVLAF